MKKHVLIVIVMVFFVFYYTQVKLDVKESNLQSETVEFLEIRKKEGIINSPRSWSVAVFKDNDRIIKFSRGGRAKKYLKENLSKGDMVTINWFNSCSEFSINNIHNCEYLLSAGGMDLNNAIKIYRDERRVFFVFFLCFISAYILFLVFILLIKGISRNDIS